MLCPDWSCSLNVRKTARDGLLANQFQACVPFSIYLSILISVYIGYVEYVGFWKNGFFLFFIFLKRINQSIWKIFFNQDRMKDKMILNKTILIKI